MSKFRDIAVKVTSSGNWIVPIFLISIAGIVVGFAAAVSDYLSSYHGYLALGTRKAEGELFGMTLAQLIAASPQVLQLVFLYTIGSSDKKLTTVQIAGAVLIWLSCFTFDTGTDVYFKAHGMPFSQWVIAFIESIFINTVVSEIAFVTSLSLFLQLAVPTADLVGSLFGDIFESAVNGLKRIGVIISDFVQSDDDGGVSGLRRN